MPPALAHDILPGHAIGAPAHLFKRIDEKMADVWRAKFGGADAKADAGADADATHVAPGMSKRKAAAAKKAADKAAADAAGGAPKSAEVLAWEQKVVEQGRVVRELKAKPKTPEVEAEITKAVEELKRLKGELAQKS